MTTSTKTMTRKAALAIAIEQVQNEDAKAVLSKMLEQISKPRAKSENATPSKARRDNEFVARAIAERVKAGETLTTNDIMAMSPFYHGDEIIPVTSTQKVVGVMSVAYELGLFSRVKDGKKVAFVRL